MPASAADETMQQSTADNFEADKAGNQGCRVYVGNLAWGVRSEELKAHMEQVGEVVKAFVFEDYQRRSKGCGIVVYKNEESAQKAIKQLTDSTLQDRPIFVREDREESGGKFSGGNSHSGGRGGYGGMDRRGGRNAYHDRRGGGGHGYGGSGGSGGRQIFVSNLPWKTSWQDLKDLFRECGEVVRADIMEMPDGRSKGVGTVLFASSDGAQRAVQHFHNYQIDGRNISVRFDRKDY